MEFILLLKVRKHIGSVEKVVASANSELLEHGQPVKCSGFGRVTKV